VALVMQPLECSGEREIFVSDSMLVDLVSLAARDADDADSGVVAGCYWKFTTADDRIIVLSAANLQYIEAFIDVMTIVSCVYSLLLIVITFKYDKSRFTME